MEQDLASRQEVRELVATGRRAFERLRRLGQDEIDRICFAMAKAGYEASRRLAEMAVEETGFGRVEGKRLKNEFSTSGLWAAIRELKTCGLVRRDQANGIEEYADPFGVVAAIIPTTNPTSTAMFKAIISVKARNAMVVSPHPRAAKCIDESIRIMHDAAVAAGAPDGLVTCMKTVTLDGTDELMKHRGVDVILATGGAGLVRAAYSSGKPAFGVGPGNCPAYVDRSADLAHAATAIVDSQTFDNSTICASEQSLVLDRPIREAFLAEMTKRGAHVCSPAQADGLAGITSRGRGMNPDIVGLDPWRLAEMAGFSVPKETTVLLADCEGVGPKFPLSIEKLSPILSVFVADGWEAGCERCLEVLRYGGMGHTLALHCTDEEVIRAFGEQKPVNRLVVNSPAAQGAVGYTTGLFPSMTLGCGSFGGNITSDNISPLHLINVKRLARVKPDYGTPKWKDGFPPPEPPSTSSASKTASVASALSPSPWSRRAADATKSQASTGASPAAGITSTNDDLDAIIRERLARLATRDE